MKKYNEPIPKGKLQQFDEILKACGGRYISNPRESPDHWGHWRVSYEYDDMLQYIKHTDLWNQMNRSVIEKTRKPNIYKRTKQYIYNKLRKK